MVWKDKLTYVRIFVSKMESKCKVCGIRFHYCRDAPFNSDTHPLSKGYCSHECLREDGGEEYDMEKKM